LALLGNYSVFNKTPGRFYSGLTIAQNRSNFNSNASFRNANQHWGKLVSIPSGYSSPYSWRMAQKSGTMSSFTQSSGVITPVCNLAAGRNLSVTTSLSINITNAQLDQIVTLVASALTTIISSGNLNASVSLQASSVLAIASNANIGAIVDVLASSGSVISVNAIITALAHMTAEAGGAPPLSAEALAQAVWDKDITTFNTTGTAGKQLQDAGSAGNPWSASLASNNTSGTFGYLIQKLLTVGKFIGLK
jgi:hypothetical protein